MNLSEVLKQIVFLYHAPRRFDLRQSQLKTNTVKCSFARRTAPFSVSVVNDMTWPFLNRVFYSQRIEFVCKYSNFCDSLVHRIDTSSTLSLRHPPFQTQAQASKRSVKGLTKGDPWFYFFFDFVLGLSGFHSLLWKAFLEIFPPPPLPPVSWMDRTPGLTLFYVGLHSLNYRHFEGKASGRKGAWENERTGDLWDAQWTNEQQQKTDNTPRSGGGMWGPKGHPCKVMRHERWEQVSKIDTDVFFFLCLFSFARLSYSQGQQDKSKGVSVPKTTTTKKFLSANTCFSILQHPKTTRCFFFYVCFAPLDRGEETSDKRGAREHAG